MTEKNIVQSLIILESPFQVLCAYEYMMKHKNCAFEVIVRLGINEQNNIQIINTLRSLKINSWTVYEITTFYKKLISIARFIKKSFSKSRIVFGDGGSIFFRIYPHKLSSAEIVLLDDGTASLKQKNIKRLKKFSIFNEQNSSVNEVNSFANIRNYLLMQKIPQNKVAVIIGAKLVEVGACSSETYIQWLKECIDFIGDEGYSLVYVCHRGEKSERIDSFCKNHNIQLKIIRAKLPIELFALEFGYHPEIFITSISTALFSYRLIYGKNARYYFNRIPDSKIINRYDGINAVFQKMAEFSEFQEIPPVTNL